MTERKEAVRAENPPWFWPAIMACFVGWTLAVVYGGYQSGYQDAIAKSEAARYYVNGEMRKIGFCKWLEISDFANECPRPAPAGEGQ